MAFDWTTVASNLATSVSGSISNWITGAASNTANQAAATAYRPPVAPAQEQGDKTLLFLGALAFLALALGGRR